MLFESALSVKESPATLKETICHKKTGRFAISPGFSNFSGIPTLVQYQAPAAYFLRSEN